MNELTVFDPINYSRQYLEMYKETKALRDCVQASLNQAPTEQRSKIYSAIHALESSMDYLASCRVIFETMEMQHEVL